MKNKRISVDYSQFDEIILEKDTIQIVVGCSIGLLFTVILFLKGYSEDYDKSLMISSAIMAIIPIAIITQTLLSKPLRISLTDKTIEVWGEKVHFSLINEVLLDHIVDSDLDASYSLLIDIQGKEAYFIDSSNRYNEQLELGDEVSKLLGKPFRERSDFERTREMNQKRQEAREKSLTKHFYEKYQDRSRGELEEILTSDSYASYAKKAAKVILNEKYKLHE